MTTAGRERCRLEPRAAHVDQLVQPAFDRTRPEVAVVAVGGYGRQELFPFSDVDLLLLTNGTPSPAQRERISEFLRILWDAGLRVSQSVHTIAECCEIHEGNLELTISLLDRRFLCGDRARYDQLEAQFPKFLDEARSLIAVHLVKMTRGRHAKHGDTIHHLEPNVKEHPGGLRDLHVIHWLRLLRPFETEPLDAARAFLFDLRTKLHEYFQRDNNLLSFEAQEWLSGDPAAWMRTYYRNARQIHRATLRALEACDPPAPGLLSQFRDWRTRLSNSEFTVARERVLLRNPAHLQSDPAIVMRLLQFIARHRLPLAPDTERRLENVQNLHCTWDQLRPILALPRCANALRAMADLGLLRQIVPEWSRIDCLVVRDFYHRYTVDEHTLVAVRSLEELPAGFMGGLMSEADRPDLLRLALLMHDIGKGSGPGPDNVPHSIRSVEIARQVMERLGVPEDDRGAVLFLVEQHLALSSVMTSRDLSEPSTARQIAEITGTIERLKLLTLLTYADIAAVNPAAMTPWRMEQLWNTYLAGHAQFTRALEAERIQAHGETSPQGAAFLDGLPTRYLKTHTPAQIAAHIELARQAVGVHLAKVDSGYRLTVIAPDRPFLLASISGALASFGMNILKAEAFGNRRKQALDTFVFEDPHRTLELNPGEAERLRDVVLRAVEEKVDIEQLIRKRRRTPVKPRVQPSVSFNNDVADSSTLIEIAAEDRPGLLYDLARAISSGGANIEVILIDTEAHRALDVFYVTSDGGKLPVDRQAVLKRSLLEACGGGGQDGSHPAA